MSILSDGIIDSDNADNVTAVIRKAVGREFTDDSRLVELGVDSLAAVRMILTLIPDSDSEIDLSVLVDLRTVGEFRHWIEQQAALASSSRLMDERHD
ncbi:hypothetical protein AO263_33695 [Pseudomonas sp. NZIPFR-PS5]|nr:hypothetical protein AO263_33695 [Pseudomonas sp. NZIPFR-PS5]